MCVCIHKHGKHEKKKNSETSFTLNEYQYFRTGSFQKNEKGEYKTL